jgi:hypothetical protein
LTKLFIINSNWQTAIYLDCFIINTEGEVLNHFNPSFLEMQPNYGYFGFHKFQNDTTYALTMVSYDTIDDNDEIEVRTSEIQKISLTKSGSLIKTVEKQETDTLYRRNH